MAKHIISAIALIGIVALSSCDGTQSKPQETPWGTVVGADESADTISHANSHITLDDIIANGEIIVGTTPGPETYYQYRGMELGTQYTLFAMLAKKLGIAPRVETSADTAQLAEKAAQRTDRHSPAAADIRRQAQLARQQKPYASCRHHQPMVLPPCSHRQGKHLPLQHDRRLS